MNSKHKEQELFNNLDIPNDLDEFPGELEINDEAEVMVLFDDCDDCSNKDVENKSLMQKIKVLQKSKEFLQGKLKDLENLPESNRKLLASTTKENVTVKQKR